MFFTEKNCSEKIHLGNWTKGDRKIMLFYKYVIYSFLTKVYNIYFLLKWILPCPWSLHTLILFFAEDKAPLCSILRTQVRIRNWRKYKHVQYLSICSKKKPCSLLELSMNTIVMLKGTYKFQYNTDIVCLWFQI